MTVGEEVDAMDRPGKLVEERCTTYLVDLSDKMGFEFIGVGFLSFALYYNFFDFDRYRLHY